MKKEFYHVKETAEILSVSQLLVLKEIKKMHIPAVRVGRVWRIPRSYFEQLGIHLPAIETKEGA